MICISFEERQMHRWIDRCYLNTYCLHGEHLHRLHCHLALCLRLGQLGQNTDEDDLMMLLASERPRFNHVWRDFKSWVQATQPKADHLSLEKLKAKTMHQIAVVEPKIIAAAFDTLEEMMTRLGLMVNGVVRAESAGRVVVADEKGFSTRSDVTTRGVITHSGRSKAATASAVTNFDHLTLCSWLPMRGPPLPPGIVVPQKRLHESFQRLWPGANFWANPGGSQTACSFVEMLERCCLQPLRERYPNTDDRCLLLLDTGGGSHLHVTPSVMV